MKKDTIIIVILMYVFMNSYCSESQAIEISNKSILEKVDLKCKEFRLDKNFNKEVIEKEENKINSNIKIDNSKQDDGKWLLENGKWYYIDRYGEKIKNRTYTIYGKTYIFGYDGAMIEDVGFINLSDKNTFYGLAAYYGNGDGTVKTSQWILDNGLWYYVYKDGVMLESCTYEEDGKYYDFDKNGVCLNK